MSKIVVEAVKGVHPWARWEATDKDGRVWEYENEPYALEIGWAQTQGDGRYEYVRPRFGDFGDWRNTLRRVNV